MGACLLHRSINTNLRFLVIQGGSNNLKLPYNPSEDCTIVILHYYYGDGERQAFTGIRGNRFKNSFSWYVCDPAGTVSDRFAVTWTPSTLNLYCSGAGLNECFGIRNNKINTYTPSN